MLDSLQLLDKWPDVVKDTQRGWIGRSEGTNVNFKLTVGSETLDLPIFTTRVDTLFGVSFIAISHESFSLLNEISDSNSII